MARGLCLVPDEQLSFVERRGVYWIGFKQRRWWSLVLAIPVLLHLIDGVNHCLEPASTTRMPVDLTVSKTLLRVLAAFLILEYWFHCLGPRYAGFIHLSRETKVTPCSKLELKVPRQNIRTGESK